MITSYNLENNANLNKSQLQYSSHVCYADQKRSNSSLKAFLFFPHKWLGLRSVCTSARISQNHTHNCWKHWQRRLLQSQLDGIEGDQRWSQRKIAAQKMWWEEGFTGFQQFNTALLFTLHLILAWRPGDVLHYEAPIGGVKKTFALHNIWQVVKP